MIIAGLDIGNATTELVLVDLTSDGPKPVAATRRPTVGIKGSESSLRAAATLMLDTERDFGVSCADLVIADIAPALQRTTSWPLARPDHGAPATILDTPHLATRAGHGTAVGTLIDIDHLGSDQRARQIPLIVTVGPSWTFERVADALNKTIDSGNRVVGVLLSRDEAVLVGNRLRQRDVVIVDQVDVTRAATGVLAVVEVGNRGGSLRRITDPVWLARSLGFDSSASDAMVPICASLRERTCAVVIAQASNDASEQQGYVLRTDGSRVPLGWGPDELAMAINPGSIAKIVVPPGSDLHSVLDQHGPTIRDLFAVRVRDGLRVPYSLLSGSSHVWVAESLATLSRRPVTVVGSEAVAAYYGALTTPGAPHNSTVIDIGGGTIDVARREQSITVAGAGDLVTAAIAEQLRVPASIAELVKMNSSLRIESPFIATTEEGDRVFLKERAPARAVGWLCVQPSPHEFVPFSDNLTAGQWRERRFDIKGAVLGGSVRRALRNVDFTADGVLLTGGGACDNESVSVLTTQLGTRVVGRANIAGRFGPRWAVAWGLVLQFIAPTNDQRLARGSS